MIETGASMTGLGLALLAVAGLTPLKTVEPYVIRVDSSTGIVEVMSGLTDTQERVRLGALISKGKATAKVMLKARILLKADQAEGGPGWLDDQILTALDTNLTMVSRTRETFVTEGLDAVLTRKKHETPPVPAIFDGEAQAKLTALACSQPPLGHARWTIRLLAEHVVERKIVPAAHFNTVGRALKKTISNRT